MALKQTFCMKAVIKQVEKAAGKVTQAVAEQALADSSAYVPKGSGALAASAIAASDTENGLIVWDTPYARQLYYGGGNLWFERAQAVHGDAWMDTAKETFTKNRGRAWH